MNYDQAKSSKLSLFRQANELNSILSLVLSNFPNQKWAVAATFPSLDMNIWGTYPEIQNQVAGGIYGLGKKKSCQQTHLCGKRWKRSFFGLTAELLLFLIRPRFQIRQLKTISPIKKYSSAAVFTYSDFDPIDRDFFEKSHFWGNLTKWWSKEEGLLWIGVGEKSREINPGFEASVSKLQLVADFFASVPKRVELWKQIRFAAGENELFKLLRSEFFRGIFGVPGLLAEHYLNLFDSFLDLHEVRSILIPYENQTWERVLAQVSAKKNVTLFGAIHTTPRFWDTRFFSFEAFADYQPKFLIDNGQASRDFLLQGGFQEDKILHGTALRFSHLSTFNDQQSRENFSTEKQARVLAILGASTTAARRLISVMRQAKRRMKLEVVYRPHPALQKWFSLRFPFEPVDYTSIEIYTNRYVNFVTESTSSLGLELASIGRRVAVFVPRDCLNFSPLLFMSDFNDFFSDSESLVKLLNFDAWEKVSVETILDITGQKDCWTRIKQQLLS
jgi:hypothetical protein